MDDEQKKDQEDHFKEFCRNPITAESTEMARIFWSSLQKDQENKKSLERAKATLTKIKKLAERAAKLVEDSEETPDNLRKYGAIHFPK